MHDFILLLLYSIAGSFCGVITGLIPGLHTNSIAIILLAIASKGEQSFYFCIFIVAAAIAHTFLDIIPSTFIGAPEEDTALTVLPAHKMVLGGKGYEAICISAVASSAAIAISFILLIPFRFLLGEPMNFYEIMEKSMPWILICISLIVIMTNQNIFRAALVFMLTGIFGIAALKLDTSFLIPSSPIFPALAGLFGASALLYTKQKILPEQKIDEIKVKINGNDVGRGVAAGSIVAILPGVSAAIAATLALVAKKEEDERGVIAVLSATNTATNFFVLAMLFVMMKTRSGFAVAMKELVEIKKWDGVVIPYPYNLFLIAVIISSIISYYMTLLVGKFVAKNISRISYSSLIKISFGIMVALVSIFTGIIGLIIFAIASIIGIICLEMKVKRSVCMGFLLLPLIISYF